MLPRKFPSGYDALSAEAKARFAQTELWLIRHGETEWNSKHVLQGTSLPFLDPRIVDVGSIDVPLNEKGEFYAELVAEHFHRLVNKDGLEFGGIYSSSLQRANKTANIIASKLEGLSVEKDPRLNEISFGEWEGKPMETVHLLRASIAFEDKLGGGDSYKDLQERMSDAVADLCLKHAGENVIVVTHGAALRTLLCYILRLDFDHLAIFQVQNCSITRVKPYYNKERPELGTLVCANDTSHLSHHDEYKAKSKERKNGSD